LKGAAEVLRVCERSYGAAHCIGTWSSVLL